MILIWTTIAVMTVGACVLLALAFFYRRACRWVAAKEAAEAAEAAKQAEAALIRVSLGHIPMVQFHAFEGHLFYVDVVVPHQNGSPHEAYQRLRVGDRCKVTFFPADNVRIVGLDGIHSEAGPDHPMRTAWKGRVVTFRGIPKIKKTDGPNIRLLFEPIDYSRPTATTGGVWRWDSAAEEATHA